MSVYTLVDEGYDVIVVSSIVKVIPWICDCRDQDRKIISKNLLREHFQNNRTFYAYTFDEEGEMTGNGWAWKVERHD